MKRLNIRKADKPTRRACAERMVEYGGKDTSFVVLEADIGHSTYSYLFAEKYPERYFQMGIAESNMMSAAAGMAANGRTAVVSGYGVFLTMRAVESVRSFICYPDLNVKLFASHGGITASTDGVTHQSTEDIAYMSTLPHMKVIVPADSASARRCFDLSMQTHGPVYIRLMRDALYEIYDRDEDFIFEGSKVIVEGTDVTLVSYGDILFQMIKAAEELDRMGISAEVVDAYSVKPVDWDSIKKSIMKTGALLVAENHQQRNGLGYELAYRIVTENLPLRFKCIGLNDTFAETGEYSKLLDAYNLSASRITAAVEMLVEK